MLNRLQDSNAEDIPRLIKQVKTSYEGITSNTSMYLLTNEAFEVGDSTICESAFLQTEKAEDEHSLRYIMYSMNLGDIDSEKSWKSKTTEGVLTIPMKRNRKVLTEVYIADKKTKEVFITAFDVAAPDYPDQFINGLKKLVAYCEN